MDIKDRIAKLLALSKSPNEHEAKQALIKAQELMAVHKLCKDDIAPARNQMVIRQLIGVYCTKRLNSWMVPLSAVIAENYCCTAWRNHRKHAQKVEIGFIGFEDDFYVCEAVFKYAVDCVLSYCKQIRVEYKDIYLPKYIARLTDAYGFGFANGVNAAFARQKDEHREWGLVLIVPTEVQEVANEMETTIFKKSDLKSQGELKYTQQGYEDGQDFDPSTKLPQEIKKSKRA